MAKKKKSRQDENMRQKVEEAQRRKDYFMHLREICNRIHPDLFPMLTQKQLMAIYKVRGMSFKVVTDGKVSQELLEYVNGFARYRQKEEVFPLGMGMHLVNLIEYQRYLSPLEWLIRPDAPYDPEIRQDPNRFKGIPWYESFVEGREERHRQFYLRVTEMLAAITFFMSDYRYALYYTYFKTGAEIAKSALDVRHHQHIHIQPLRPERKRIRIQGGEIRNALRLGVVLPPDAARLEQIPERYRYFPMSIRPSSIGVEGVWSKISRPVYVTEHALNRLDERTGCATPGYTQMCMGHSFMNQTALKTNDNRLLLGYQVRGHKIGYLVLSIQRNSILIHTFLFLTANGTPEGQKLREQLGLQKRDHQYLGIDKLSTFVHSDILQHEDVCEWFRNAGCESLLTVCGLLQGDHVWEEEGEQIQLAGRLREYLRTQEPMDRWDFPEEEDSEDETEPVEDDENEDE